MVQSRTASTVGIQACPACHRIVEKFGPGPGGRRPNARCPKCGALERHRFLALLLEATLPVIPSARVVLDIAPSRQTTRILSRTHPQRYIRLDFDPQADGRAVDVRASMTAIPLPDASVDLAVCYHVLEHIPDDRQAMSELRRVLAPGGVGFVQVPWKPHRPDTDEDPSASVEERLRRFGQADHVRYYGADFEQRLRDSGLRFTRVTPKDVVGSRVGAFFALIPNEAVWLVRRDDMPERDVPPESLRLRTLTFMYALLEQSEARTKRERAAYERLRSRLPIRVAAAARRRVRALTSASPRPGGP